MNRGGTRHSAGHTGDLTTVDILTIHHQNRYYLCPSLDIAEPAGDTENRLLKTVNLGRIFVTIKRHYKAKCVILDEFLSTRFLPFRII